MTSENHNNLVESYIAIIKWQIELRKLVAAGKASYETHEARVFGIVKKEKEKK